MIFMVLDAIATAVNAAVSFGEWLLDQAFRGIKGGGNFIFQNFHYDKPKEVGVLALLYIGAMIVLVCVFIAGSGVVLIGSSAVAGGSGGNNKGIIQSVADVQASQVPGSLAETAAGVISINKSFSPSQSDSLGSGLCGNGRCEQFKTSAKYVDSGISGFPSCDIGRFYYNVPSYCVGSPVKTYASSDGLNVFSDAYCEASVSSDINPLCAVDSDSLFYIESFTNCPYDCNKSTLYSSCFYNLACSESGGSCPDFAPLCCPDGSANAGRCVDNEGFWFLTDYYCSAEVTPVKPLSDYFNVRFGCECSSSNDCIGDRRGSLCCPAGYAREGFCAENIEDC